MDINPAETKSLPAHVAACGARYGNLHEQIVSMSNKINRLERGALIAMTAIISLLIKIAFFPGAT